MNQHDSNEPTTTYAVSGMTCGHCEAAVREEVEAIAGVTSAKADSAAGALIVTGNATVDEIAAAVDEAGYTLTA
jgi:copper chaperone CopZ